MGTSLYPSAMEPRKPGACFRPRNLGVDSRVVTFRLGEHAKLLTYPILWRRPTFVLLVILCNTRIAKSDCTSQ